MLVIGWNFLMLLLAFRSVVVPIKAVLMNVLSLGASYGLLVWIFQDGHLAGLLGFEPLEGIDPTIPLVMFAVVFGLSMDYEVFLLSRIREEWLRTGDNRAERDLRPRAHRAHHHQRRADPAGGDRRLRGRGARLRASRSVSASARRSRST